MKYYMIENNWDDRSLGDELDLTWCNDGRLHFETKQEAEEVVKYYKMQRQEDIDLHGEDCVFVNEYDSED